jgi:glucose-1-phosphate adenylyltransferase
MDHTTIGKGARLQRAIVDRFNAIEPGETIGYDRGEDARHYHVDPSGLVVRARGITRWF